MVDKIQPNLPADYTNNVNRSEGDLGISRESNRYLQGAPARQFDSASAEVSLSDNARVLQQVTQAAIAAPELRDDVVQQIQSQLDAGTYRVNVAALADRLFPLLK